MVNSTSMATATLKFRLTLVPDWVARVLELLAAFRSVSGNAWYSQRVTGERKNSRFGNAIPKYFWQLRRRNEEQNSNPEPDGKVIVRRKCVLMYGVALKYANPALP